MSLGSNASVLCKPLARSTKHFSQHPGMRLFSHKLRNRNIEHSLNFLILRVLRVSRGCDHLSALAPGLDKNLTSSEP